MDFLKNHQEWRKNSRTSFKIVRFQYMVQVHNEKYIRMLKSFPFIYLKSHIWLNKLQNDCYLGYIPKLKRNTNSHERKQMRYVILESKYLAPKQLFALGKNRAQITTFPNGAKVIFFITRKNQSIPSSQEQIMAVLGIHNQQINFQFELLPILTSY